MTTAEIVQLALGDNPENMLARFVEKPGMDTETHTTTYVVAFVDTYKREPGWSRRYFVGIVFDKAGMQQRAVVKEKLEGESMKLPLRAVVADIGLSAICEKYDPTSYLAGWLGAGGKMDARLFQPVTQG